MGKQFFFNLEWIDDTFLVSLRSSCTYSIHTVFWRSILLKLWRKEFNSEYSKLFWSICWLCGKTLNLQAELLLANDDRDVEQVRYSICWRKFFSSHWMSWSSSLAKAKRTGMQIKGLEKCNDDRSNRMQNNSCPISVKMLSVLKGYYPPEFSVASPLKGSVQRKLRWVKTGVNRWVWASDHGPGQYFIVKVSLHLALSLFPFLVSTTQFIGELWNNRWSGVSDLASVLLALHRKKYWRCDAPCAYRWNGAHLPRL